LFLFGLFKYHDKEKHLFSFKKIVCDTRQKTPNRYHTPGAAVIKPVSAGCKHPITSSLNDGLVLQVRGKSRRHNAATGDDSRFKTSVFMSLLDVKSCKQTDTFHKRFI